ncbi:MAG: T9SS type A sorting domain-containing protein [Chitinophagales bacterium]|nr:T9SS type A sorting domain-containing protein [Chitinophagales bacterium]
MELKNILPAFVTTCILLCSIYFFPRQTNIETAIIQEKKEGPLEPDEWLYAQKSFPYGKIDFQAQKNAIQHTLRQKRMFETMRTDGYRDEDWQFVGPVTIGGRVQDIEMPAGSDQTVFVGSASGGILRSYDLGETWQMIFDAYESLSIGDITIDPVDTNIIYAGTGEPNCGGGSLTYDGNGIYKSTNGGDTWSNIGLTAMGNTGRLAINPQNTQIIFAAMMGNLFENNTNRGLFRTEDGGVTWENVLFSNDSTGAIDVVIDPVNPNIIYTAMWERVRRHNRRDYAGLASRIYKSTDGGDTWNVLTTGLPTGQLSRITLTLCAADPDVLYACILGSDASLLDIYKTTNGGTSWTDLNCADELPSAEYDYWFGGVKVDPTDADKVYYIGFACARSENGGLSWDDFANSAHVDNHSLYISPADTDFKILGNDGGLNFTFNDFTTYTTAQNIPVTQIYAMDVFHDDSSFVMGGAQDNGSFMKSPGTDDWYFVNGGDGVSNKFLQTNSESYYANYQYGGYYGLVDGDYVYLSGFDYGDRYIWRSPMALNPLNPYTIYIGGSRMYRTEDGGFTVNDISDDLSNGPGYSPVVYGCISNIHNAKADTNFIYAGTDDGNVWVSKNYGDDWDLISDDLPERFVTGIETDVTDANIVYVTFSGYRWADDAAHVYRSTNAGETWENISGDLPDIPANDIAIKNNNDTISLYVANDAGVFASYDEGATWTVMGSAMPVVSVYDIVLHEATNTLFAGTYGRGIYKIHLPDPPPPDTTIAINQTPDLYFHVFPNPVQDHLEIQCSNQRDQIEINVYNAPGRMIFTQKYTSSEAITVNTKNWAIGFYFVECIVDNKKITQKIIKL